MLDILPPELCLHVLAYLFCSDLTSLHALSHSWSAFMESHAEPIYHRAAIQHQFVKAFETPIEDNSMFMFGPSKQPRFKTWKAYCSARCRLERNWAGHGRSAVKSTSLGPEGVWRIKVDAGDGIALVSSTGGGIMSLDLHAHHRPLWSIPEIFGYDFAHVEYDNGFLLFNRRDGAKEVWRRAADFSVSDLPKTNGPDVQMLQSAHAATAHPAFSAFAASRRGVFAPWGVIQPPMDARAYRFVHPDLLIAARRTAYIYDVRTMALVLVLSETQPPRGNMDLRYVDLNQHHIFICFEEALHVFNRRGGQRLIKLSVIEFVRNQTLHTFISNPGPIDQDAPSVLRAGIVVPTPANDHTIFFGDGDGPTFHAVHVSDCGRHLVVLLSDNRVVLIEDFQRLFRIGQSVRNIATTIVFNTIQQDWSLYLAYVNGRVGVASCAGIMVITLDPSIHGVPSRSAPSSTMQSFPRLRVASAIGFDNSRKLRRLSCLQLTQTALFFPWKSTSLRGEDAQEEDMASDDENINGTWLGSRLCMIDTMPLTEATTHGHRPEGRGPEYHPAPHTARPRRLSSSRLPTEENRYLV